MIPFCVIWIATSAGLPPEIETVQSNRLPEQTWHVKFSAASLDETPWVFNLSSNPLDPNEEVTEREVTIPQPAVVEHFVSERAGDTLRETNQGDLNGRHPRQYQEVLRFLKDHPEYRDTDQMHDNRFAQPHYNLVYDDKLWHLEGRAVSAHVDAHDQAAQHAPYDLSELGIGPIPSVRIKNQSGISKQFMGEILSSATYASSAGRNAHRITGEAWLGGCDWRIEWDLDKNRGNQPVRSALYRDGEFYAESRTQLGEFEGRWFPKKVEYLRAEYKGGNEPYHVIDVQEASFDEPWHRQDPFTPSDIGLAFGQQVSGVADGFAWDGSQIITMEEHDQLIYLEGIDPDPEAIERLAMHMHMSVDEYMDRLDTHDRPLARARWEKRYGTPYVPQLAVENKDDPWDLYVKDFLAKNKLPDVAVKRAEKQLKRAKAVRATHYRKEGDRLKDAEKRGDKKTIDEFNKRKEKIFKELLVRPLDDLAKKAEATAKR